MIRCDDAKIPRGRVGRPCDRFSETVILAVVGLALCWPARLEVQGDAGKAPGAKQPSPVQMMQQMQAQMARQAQGGRPGQGRGRNWDRLGLGKATFLRTFNCKRCGATIGQYPVAVDFGDLKTLEDNCKVHLQSSRRKNGQETGKLDRTEFLWSAPANPPRSTLVDVREVIKANDPRFNNKTEWARVFLFRYDVLRVTGYYPLTTRERDAGAAPKPRPPVPVKSDFVGREVWVESQFLMNLNSGCELKGDEVYCGQTHFPKRKVQDFWAEFCERYFESGTKQDPDVAARVNAEYKEGIRRLEQRILGMATNNALRYRKTATEKLLNSLATKAQLESRTGPEDHHAISCQGQS